MSSESTPLRYHPDDDEPISLAIVRAISKVNDHDVATDGPILYRYIDPDALDRLSEHEVKGGLMAIEFTVGDMVVIVWDDGQTVIDILHADSPSQ